MEFTEEKQNTPSTWRAKTVIASFFVFLFLLGLGFFMWRVVYYSNAIRNGDFVFSDLTFVQDASYSNSLSSKPVPDGVFETATSDDPSLGSPDAKVEIVEFADFGCTFSNRSSSVMRRLSLEYGDRIHYVYRDFPVAELHPDAALAAEAGECADDQGKFWAYHDRLYVQQTDLKPERLVQIADEVGINHDSFVTCLNSRKYKAEVEKDYQDGLEAGVQGTPTFFINGNRIPGSIPEDVLRSLINRILENGSL